MGSADDLRDVRESVAHALGFEQLLREVVSELVEFPQLLRSFRIAGSSHRR